jgi:ATP-dependent DNA helicase RecQ
MTRARETLAVMKMESRPNPFIFALKGAGTLHRKPRMSPRVGERRILKRYEMLGLEDVYMDYAGAMPAGHPIHNRLAATQAGDEVTICPAGSAMAVRNRDGDCIAKLSATACRRMAAKIGEIETVRVIAMLERDRCDPDEEFISRIKADRWEVPVLEVVFKERGGR